MPHALPDLRRRPTLAAACAGGALLLAGVVASGAGAQTGGGASADVGGASPAPAAASGPAGGSGATTGKGKSKDGGVRTGGPPKPLLITCRTACAGLDAVQPGGTVRVTGDAMSGARTVVFLGDAGAGDDRSAPAVPVTGDAVDVTVPQDAVSGPVAVVDARGAVSRTTGKTIAVTGADRAAKAAVAPAARVEVRKVFFRGPHRATLSVFVPGVDPRHVAVDLVRDRDRKPVAHWELDVPGSTVQSVSWSGVVDGQVQRDGVYRFQVSAPPPGASTAQADGVAAAFRFLGDAFPIRGKHDLGGGGAGRFGAGRNGHSHQGQDVFAACGTPLVAARGGVVKFRDFQSAAGNYVVIDAAGTGVDYAYMHLKAPALVGKGDTVYTGQPIGEVGDTGDAVGCHLHFELWSAPGWYTGGSPFDPLPALKRWDASS